MMALGQTRMILSDPSQTSGSGSDRCSQHTREMRSPLFKSVLAVCKKLVSLIHGGHTGDRSGLVIENLVRHVGGDAKTRHS